MTPYQQDAPLSIVIEACCPQFVSLRICEWKHCLASKERSTETYDVVDDALTSRQHLENVDRLILILSLN